MRRPLSVAVCPTPDIWPEGTACKRKPPTVRVERHPVRVRPAVHGIARRRVGVRRATPERPARPARPARPWPPAAPRGIVDLSLRGMDAEKARRHIMDEEKLRILKMVEDDKISASDAVKLIEALEKTGNRPSERELKKKWVHIQVTKDGERNVDVKIPLSLLKFGFKLAPKAAMGLKGFYVGGRHGLRSDIMSEKARARAEKARARAEKIRAKAQVRAEKLREMSDRYKQKFGEDFTLGEDFEEILEDTIEETVEDAMEAAVEGLGENGFDLDLESILRMASEDGFDGKIVEVHNDDDDEHIKVTLE